MRIDTHAHVFTRNCPLAADRRYDPEGEAPLETYLRLLDRHGLSHGVLIQPSFLGTDNRYLMAALEQEPDRLRGVAVIGPDIGKRDLRRLAEAGVVGIRLNLLGRERGVDLSGPEWRRLFAQVTDLDWLIEVHGEGPALSPVLAVLSETRVRIVIDHFGRPDARRGVSCNGFADLLRAAEGGRIWVKLSAPYRCRGADVRPYAEVLLANLGPGRLLWGSDWPWTQHADGMAYVKAFGWLEDWVPDDAARAAILGQTPEALFRFVTAAA